MFLLHILSECPTQSFFNASTCTADVLQERQTVLRQDFLLSWKRGRGQNFFPKGACSISDDAEKAVFADFELFWHDSGLNIERPASCDTSQHLRVQLEGFCGDRWRKGKGASIRASIKKFRSVFLGTSTSVPDSVSILEHLAVQRRERLERQREIDAKVAKALDSHYTTIPKSTVSFSQNQIQSLKSQLADRQMQLSFKKVSKAERLARENYESLGQTHEYVRILRNCCQELQSRVDSNTILPWNLVRLSAV